jgi:putative oxidoreductase
MANETCAANCRHDRTTVDLALLVVRLTAGIIFIAHGGQKMFGLWGGSGLSGIVGMLGPLGYLVAIGEFFGGIGLVLGILSRFSAASLVVIMIGAIWMVHGKNGFFAPKGFEYNLALIGLTLPTVLAGPGRLALASLLPKKLRCCLQ